MVADEHFFVYQQRALHEGPCRGEFALRLKQIPEVVEALRGVGMVGAEHLLPDRQRALEQRPRSGEIALGLK
jgi:hypothetical protein